MKSSSLWTLKPALPISMYKFSTVPHRILKDFTKINKSKLYVQIQNIFEDHWILEGLLYMNVIFILLYHE